MGWVGHGNSTMYHQVDDWPGKTKTKKKGKLKMETRADRIKIDRDKHKMVPWPRAAVTYVWVHVCVCVSNSRSSQKVRLPSVPVHPAESLSRRAKANKQNAHKFVLSASSKIIVVSFVRLYNFSIFSYSTLSMLPSCILYSLFVFLLLFVELALSN